MLWFSFTAISNSGEHRAKCKLNTLEGGDSLLSYFHEFRDENVTYSVDKVILTGRFLSSKSSLVSKDVVYESTGDIVPIKVPERVECGQVFLDILSSFNHPFDYWSVNSPRPGFYKHNFCFSASDDSTFYLGVGLGVPGDDNKNMWKLEFNPNKCGASISLGYVLSKLRLYSSEWFLKDWDLAVDYSVLRENCFLVKDKRKYSLVENSSSDKTEYLGNRHHSGYAKLYNKQIESKLNYPLTRLELTMEGLCTASDIREKMPTVWCLNDLQMTFSDDLLDQNDHVLFWAVLQQPNLLTSLSYRKRKKIEHALAQHALQLGVNNKPLLAIIKQMEQYRQLIIPK